MLFYLFLFFRFICEINPSTKVDKREKGAKRRQNSFDSTVKKLMSALENVVKTLQKVTT